MRVKILLLILVLASSGCLSTSSNLNPPIEPEEAEVKDFEKSVQNLTDYESYTIVSNVSASGFVVTNGLISLQKNQSQKKYKLNYFLLEEEYLQYYSNGTLYNSLVNPNRKFNSTSNISYSEIPYSPNQIDNLPVSISNLTVEQKENKEYEYNMDYNLKEDVKLPSEYSTLKSGELKLILSQNGDFREMEIREELPRDGTAYIHVVLTGTNSTSVQRPDWIEEIGRKNS